MKTKDAINHFGSGTELCKAAGIHKMNWIHWGYWIPEKYARIISEKHRELKFNSKLYDGKTSLKIAGHTFNPAVDISSTRLLEKSIKEGITVLCIDNGIITKLNGMAVKERADLFRNNPIYTSDSQVEQIVTEPQKVVKFQGLELLVPLVAKFISVGLDGSVLFSDNEMFIPSDTDPYFYGWLTTGSYMEPLCKINVGKNLDWKKSQVEVK